ncbi:MAG: hypothetical protein IJR60_06065 [Eubacterium sp.]|nr:hypothetical protein [Eubacterium sp.]
MSFADDLKNEVKEYEKHKKDIVFHPPYETVRCLKKLLTEAAKQGKYQTENGVNIITGSIRFCTGCNIEDDTVANSTIVTLDNQGGERHVEHSRLVKAVVAQNDPFLKLIGVDLCRDVVQRRSELDRKMHDFDIWRYHYGKVDKADVTERYTALYTQFLTAELGETFTITEAGNPLVDNREYDRNSFCKLANRTMRFRFTYTLD